MKNTIKNFAFIDLETTGLLHQNIECKITELSVTVAEAENISLGVYPRVRNNLNLCINPQQDITPTVSYMTGLNNNELKKQPIFSEEIVEMLQNFLNLYEKPICLVAHNGNNFDYPILQKEIINTGKSLDDDILCIDSLLCFRNLYYSKKLPTNSRTENIKSSNNIYFDDGFDELLCKAVDEYEKSVKLDVLEIQKRNERTPTKQKKNFNSESNEGYVFRKNIKSFKLGDLYTYFTSREPNSAHQAGQDVEMLLHCAASCGSLFTDWAEQNCIKFNAVPAAYSPSYLKRL